MNLLVAVIENSEDVEPILELLYENDFAGVTVLHSQGMGHMIADRYSVFGRFGDLTGSANSPAHNNVMFMVIETEESINRAIEIIKKVVGDLDQPDAGIVFTVPLGRVEGFNTPLNTG